MAQFASKTAPAGDKLRGGYYTPQPIAAFVAEWVAEAGASVLEPSCGDGAILAELVTRETEPTAVELVSVEAGKARDRTGVDVIEADLFEWFTPGRHGTFDGVAGNPPYIRFGSWDEDLRTPALDLMRTQGMRPNKMTNAWVPFVVASVLAVRSGGRVGLVLPAELLQVGYAAALRAFLVDQCAALTVVSFQRLVFPGILQEVVLLLAERGSGPAAIRTAEVPDASRLADLDLNEQPAVRAHLHENEKWTKYYLAPSAITALREARADSRLSPVHDFAEVDVGVVSGRNSFFVLTKDESERRGIAKWCTPVASRSAHIPGVTFGVSDLNLLDASDGKTRLLALSDGTDVAEDPALSAYLVEGEVDGVPEGYKCRIRRNWWQVPAGWVPDGFMLRQISTHPRLVVNDAGATTTDTVHRVRTRSGVDMSQLAAGAFNSATFALAEIIGRSYGGGILELEPSEAEELPVPDPRIVPPSLTTKVDELVRGRRIIDALDLVDQAVLIDVLGYSQDEVQVFRNAWMQLSQRRAGRGKKPRVTPVG